MLYSAEVTLIWFLPGSANLKDTVWYNRGSQVSPLNHYNDIKSLVASMVHDVERNLRLENPDMQGFKILHPQAVQLESMLGLEDPSCYHKITTSLHCRYVFHFLLLPEPQLVLQGRQTDLLSFPLSIRFIFNLVYLHGV